ncbi:MAG: hypothetical protein AB1568_16100 [Thermodesulfobacteriota bacterium]
MTVNEFDKNMTAAAFAEAGEHSTAQQMVADAGTAGKGGKAPAKKPVLPMLITGVLSLAGYVLLLQNEKLVTEVFTRGGYAAVYPIVAAFAFSFVHGAFASNLLSVLGLEAKKK